jgi:hypothetical protein
MFASAGGMFVMNYSRYHGQTPQVRANPQWVVKPIDLLVGI